MLLHNWMCREFSKAVVRMTYPGFDYLVSNLLDISL